MNSFPRSGLGIMGVTVSGHGGEGVVGVRHEQSFSTHLCLVVTFNYLIPPCPSLPFPEL